jgi:hypothetical protein
MIDDLKKLLMNKKDKQSLSDQEKQAKMEVLKELVQMAQEMLGGKVKSGMDEMNKVSVLADDKDGLKEGLEKAQEIVEEQPELKSSEAAPEKEEAEEESEPKYMSSITDEEEDEDSMFNKLSKKNRE